MIADYKLKDQQINTVDVIEKSNMQEKHVLVTGKHINEIKKIKEESNFLEVFFKT